MANKMISPDLIFETSWEVCNKVGGIYTVLSSRAKTLQEKWKDKVFFIGPDLHPGENSIFFKEDGTLLSDWKKAAAKYGLPIRVGRWQVPGTPIAVLVDFTPCYRLKNDIYAQAWEDFKVDSLRAYGDYDEASMFSYAAGRMVEIIYKECLPHDLRVVYQAHEWMSGLGMLHLKKTAPRIATIFTTHATSIGRSIAGNNKELYAYFEGYDGDQMARELHMEAKHSIEKRSAEQADCFTTVSSFTDRECAQLLGKSADVVLPNGFEDDFVPKGNGFAARRKKARRQILRVAACLTGDTFDDDTLIVSTSGRNDFRCKGFDVYLQALRSLNQSGTSRKVVALIEVPCWTKAPRRDLLQRLEAGGDFSTPLDLPMITHELFNPNDDRILGMIRQLGLWNRKEDSVKVLLVPCYLEGADGIFNLPYYNLLTANDLCVYPSYYEPWGYTPLESCAFKTPCVTTDLSGFGQWVNETLGHAAALDDGVAVLHRTDQNYFEVSEAVAQTIRDLLALNAADVLAVRKRAAQLAEKAQWKHFIQHYYEAYDFAFRKNKQQIN